MVRAAVLNAPHENIVVKEFPYPDMEEGSVTLRTLYSEVCGTDVHLFHGKLSEVPYPIIPGHVNVGVIDKIKGNITDIEGHTFREGEIVSFYDVHETCNQCWYCQIGKESTRCPNRKVYGITYSSNDGLLGGWSEYTYLKPGIKLILLGDKLDPLVFIAGGCGLVTSFHAVERSNMKIGDTIVIQGTGPVGLSAIAWARTAGAYKIISLGAPNIRNEMALRMGADTVINIDNYNPEERIKEIFEHTHGRGADITIECSGNPYAIPEGIGMTRDGGTYVVVGQYTDSGAVEINPHYDINKKHIAIKGCWGVDFSHMFKVVSMLKKYHEEFPWKEFITKVYKLNEANKAIKAVENLSVVKAIIQPTA